jgi:hypothetical protein
MNIKLIVFLNGDCIISQIEEAPSELGEPDCRLKYPFLIVQQKIEGVEPTLIPWLSDYTKQSEFMIHSDKILTISDPKPTLLEKYQNLIK